jgi:hypothetical protein
MADSEGATRAVCILVLGMHRSGTSATTRLLNLAGAELGPTLMPADPRDNPAGYWENARFHGIHEQLLAALGRSWRDPRGLPENWLEHQATRRARDELTSAFREEFGSRPLTAVKDPRLCLLWPLWQQVLEAEDRQPVGVIVTRHPGSVAASLSKRHLHPDLSLILWLRYFLEASDFSEQQPTATIRFEDLLSRSEAAMDRLRELPISWPAENALSEAAEEALDPRAVRNPPARPSNSSSDLWAHAAQIFEQLSPSSTSPSDGAVEAGRSLLAQLNPCFDKMSFAIEGELEALRRADRARRSRERAEAHGRDLETRIARLETQLEAYRRSRAHRWADQLRDLNRLASRWLRK